MATTGAHAGGKVIMRESRLPAVPRVMTVGVLWLALLGAASTASAGPMVYFYQGNTLETSGIYECPPVCNLSGSVWLANELGADRSIESTVPFLWYSFSNGISTVTPATASSGSGFFHFGTDTNGNIDEWSFQLLAQNGPYMISFHNPVSQYMYDGSPSGGNVIYTADRTFVSGCFGNTCGPIGTAVNINNPGTWTATPFDGPSPAPVPEPGTMLLMGTGLLFAVKKIRNRPSA